MINPDVHFVCYLYIMDLINAREMGHSETQYWSIFREGSGDNGGENQNLQTHSFFLSVWLVPFYKIIRWSRLRR
jgi:hypothetical protein